METNEELLQRIAQLESNIEFLNQTLQDKEDTIEYLQIRYERKVDNQYAKRSEDFINKVKIGKGSYGVVYRVQHRLTQRAYALKEIEIKTVTNAIIKTTRREVKCLSTFDHKNIVRYYGCWINRKEQRDGSDLDSDLGDDDIDDSDFIVPGIFCIQMELCDKSSLRVAFRDESWFKEIDRRDRLFHEIVEAVAYMHEESLIKKGFIHRDLKPENIFIDGADHIKIGDFGLAIESEGDDHKPSQTDSIGTFDYRAPELRNDIIRNHESSSYSFKVDIYSLGLIFFEMHYPQKPSDQDILYHLRLSEIVLPQDVHVHLSPPQIEIVRMLLNHDVNERPTAVKLLSLPYLHLRHNQPTNVSNELRRISQNRKTEDYYHVMDQIGRIQSAITKLFQQYGQVHLSVQTEMPNEVPNNPKSKYKPREINTHHDLRDFFIRFIVKKGLTDLRRYAIEQIQAESKQIDDWSVDIVHPQSDALSASDIEFDCVNLIRDIVIQIGQSPFLDKLSFYLQLNHSNILSGLFTYFEIPEEQHSDALQIFADYRPKLMGCIPFRKKEQTALGQKFKKKKISVDKHLLDLLRKIKHEVGTTVDLSKHLIEALKGDKPHHRVGKEMIGKGIDCMNKIVSNLYTSDAKQPLKLKFAPFMLTRYHSGLTFQLINVQNQMNTRKVVAIGGRYDKLIEKEWQINKNDTGCPIAVGLSLETETLNREILYRELVKNYENRSQNMVAPTNLNESSRIQRTESLDGDETSLIENQTPGPRNGVTNDQDRIEMERPVGEANGKTKDKRQAPKRAIPGPKKRRDS